MCWCKKTLLCILFSPVFLVIGIIMLCGKLKIHYCRKQLFLNMNVEMLDGLHLGEFAQIFIILFKMHHYKLISHHCINEQSCMLLAQRRDKSVVVVISQNPEKLPQHLPQLFTQEIPHRRVILVTNSVFPSWLCLAAKQHHMVIINRDKLHRFIGLVQRRRISIFHRFIQEKNEH